jgi:hypothetical protein
MGWRVSMDEYDERFFLWDFFLRRIIYRYLSVSNSVSIATDLATEIFLNLKLK